MLLLSRRDRAAALGDLIKAAASAVASSGLFYCLRILTFSYHGFNEFLKWFRGARDGRA